MSSQATTVATDTLTLAATNVFAPKPALVALSVVAVLGAAFVLLVVWRSVRPRRPVISDESTADAAVGEFGAGVETPALVDLLTGGFSVEDDAVPATVVDLAARKFLDIEKVAGDNVILRVRRSKDTSDLTAYEQRIIAHIERRSVDGIAPAAAMTIGPEGASQRWFRSFVREVNAHGRDLGLNRRRWDLKHLAMVWGSVGFAWMMVGITGNTADRVDRTGAWGEPATVLFAVTVAAAAVLSWTAGRITHSDAQTDTDAGLAAAGRWLGVRRWMTGNTDFSDKTAPSVVLWERQLAYATALGLAPTVQRELPFETEHDRKAWSRSTGHWRRISVRYASLTPGWGDKPWVAALTGAVHSAVLGGIAYGGVFLAREQFDADIMSPEVADRLPMIGLGIAALAIAGLGWTLTRTGFGLSDLFARTEVQGELVRKRSYETGHRLPSVVQHLIWSGRDANGRRKADRRRTSWYLAVDDGTSDKIVAHRVSEQVFRQVRQGATVRLRFSPRLRWVAEAVELSPPPVEETTVVPHELVGAATEAATEMAGALTERLGTKMTAAMAATDAEGRPMRDHIDTMANTPDEDGQTLSDKLARAQTEMARAKGRVAPGSAQATGLSMLSGLFDQVTGALGQPAPPEHDEGEAEPDPAQ